MCKCYLSRYFLFDITTIQRKEETFFIVIFFLTLHNIIYPLKIINYFMIMYKSLHIYVSSVLIIYI